MTIYGNDLLGLMLFLSSAAATSHRGPQGIEDENRTAIKSTHAYRARRPEHLS
jgi:hypothetical protein